MRGAGVVAAKRRHNAGSALRWARLLCGQRCVLGSFLRERKGWRVGCQVLRGSQKSDRPSLWVTSRCLCGAEVVVQACLRRHG